MKDLDIDELGDVTGGLALRNFDQVNGASTTTPFSPFLGNGTPSYGGYDPNAFFGSPVVQHTVPAVAVTELGGTVSAGATPGTAAVGFDPLAIGAAPLAGAPAQGFYNNLAPQGYGPGGFHVGFPVQNGLPGYAAQGLPGFAPQGVGFPQGAGLLPQGGIQGFLPQGVPQGGIPGLPNLGAIGGLANALGSGNPLAAIGPLGNILGQATGNPQLGQIAGQIPGLLNAFNGGNPAGALGPLGNIVGAATGTPGLGQLGGALGGLLNGGGGGAAPGGGLGGLGNLFGGSGGGGLFGF